MKGWPCFAPIAVHPHGESLGTTRSFKVVDVLKSCCEALTRRRVTLLLADSDANKLKMESAWLPSRRLALKAHDRGVF
jgi:hypothetical protein